MTTLYAWGFLHGRDVLSPEAVAPMPAGVARPLAGGFAFAVALSPTGAVHVKGGDGLVRDGSGDAGALREGERPVACVTGAAGYDHVVVAVEQRLFGWGWNAYGQATPSCDDAELHEPVALPLPLPHPVLKVVCGERHTLLLLSDGSVYSFGDGSSGQLGDGARTGRGLHQVGLPAQARDVAAGARHSLVALIGDAGVCAFGWGLYGQCGDGGNEDVLTPCPVPSLRGVRCASVAAGLSHSACLTESGDVYLWGANDVGQLGLGKGDDKDNADAGASELTPQLLECAELEGRVRAVRCGAKHTAVLRDDGALFTWGWGAHGQLGSGDSDDRSVPHRVLGLGTVADVQCGWWHTLALA